MKNYSKFLEEATIKGSAGVPGEGSDKTDPKYLRDVERRGQEEIVAGTRDARPLFGEIMRLLEKATSLSRGKESELGKFAEKIIRSVYPDILENVDLDLKIVKSGGDVAKFMKEEDEKKEEEEEEEKPQSTRPSTDRDLKLEVDKRKLANAIMQGEAKNTKLIIEMPECRDGLKKILGDRNGQELHTTLIAIAKLANKLDWIIPIEAKAQMMEMQPGGMAGAVSVDYVVPKDKKEKSKNKAEDILKSIEEGEEIEDMDKEIEDLFSEGKPTIKARGVDFSMLIHEAVKGIYELIARVGIPQDETLAKNVMLNTASFADEAEDFKYGPYIASDLRDFINKNPKSDEYPNIREYIFGKLMIMPADVFLDSMKNILMESPKGRKLIDDLIDDIIKEQDEYEKELSEFDVKSKFGELGDEEYGEEEENEVEEEPESIPEPKSKEVDYSQMSKRDLQIEADDALDAEDIEKFKKISSFLTKESASIYLKEFERLNESNRLHIRRKK